MPKNSKSKEIVEIAQDLFAQAEEHEIDIRNQYEEDYRFSAGEQWPADMVRERDQDNRPTLTLNRLPAFISQIVSDARQNSPTIQVNPIDDGTDPELADTIEGLIRQIEAASDADQAFDAGLESAARGGFGAWRVVTDFADDETFDQEARIERIKNPLSVYFDPEAERYDKSDGRFVFVTEIISRDKFEEKYPKANPSSWEAGQGHQSDGWITKDSVRVAEFWRKEPVKREIALLSNGATIDTTDLTDEQVFAVAAEAGAEIVRARTVMGHKIVRYLLGGDEIIEGPEEWPGQLFPIVGIFGPELHIDGKTEYLSLIRYAKDAQRQYNYWASSLTEKVALAPKAPWIGTNTMFEGRENEWANANSQNFGYLAYNPDPNAPQSKPERVQAGTIANGDVQLMDRAIDDLKGTTGIFDANLGAQGNETSGKAILARQRSGDAATFAWLDNLSRSVRYTGRVLVDLIPRIYDGERIVRILGQDGARKMVKINESIKDPATGENIIKNDVTVGKYDVVVTTGPSYATQQLEAADSLMAFVQAVPGAAQLAGDLIAKNMNWPGAAEIAARLRKSLPPGIAEPEEGEEPPQPAGPSPQEMMEMAANQADIAKTQAETEGKQLDNAEKQLELSQNTGQIGEIIRQIVMSELLQVIAPQEGAPQLPADGQIPTPPGQGGF